MWLRCRGRCIKVGKRRRRRRRRGGKRKVPKSWNGNFVLVRSHDLSCHRCSYADLSTGKWNATRLSSISLWGHHTARSGSWTPKNRPGKFSWDCVTTCNAGIRDESHPSHKYVTSFQRKRSKSYHSIEHNGRNRTGRWRGVKYIFIMVINHKWEHPLWYTNGGIILSYPKYIDVVPGCFFIGIRRIHVS